MTAPFLKWAGGKTRLLPELMKRVPRTVGGRHHAFRQYYEPFAGGAALFFALAAERATQSGGPIRIDNMMFASIYDINRDLITTYLTVRNDPEAVIRRLRAHKKMHGKRHFYRVRDDFNEPQNFQKYPVNDPVRAAQFIYLNKTGFNGLFRVNKSGKFNVPMGRYTDPTIFTPTAIRAASVALKMASMGCYPYDNVYMIQKGDLVYFDPPYDPISKTSSFTGYAAGGFGRDEQKRLAEVATGLVARGAHVILSNNDTPLIRRLYPKRYFHLDRVACGRSINSDPSKRGSIHELIITGKR